MSKYGEWIEIKTRSLTEEEKEEYNQEYEHFWYGEPAFIYDCELPYNNQEVLITSKYGYVTQTTFYSDCDCYFEYYEDDDDVLAWMPLPEPYKAERGDTVGEDNKNVRSMLCTTSLQVLEGSKTFKGRWKE